MKRISLILAVLVIAVGCSKQGDSRLEERAGIDADAQIKADEKRADIMLKDLKRQSRFYEALYGEFEGDVIVNSKTLRLRINFVPKMPIYIDSDRKMTLSEVENYLINQSFNIQTLVIFDSNDRSSAAGCQTEGVKPDLNKGEVFLLSEECSYLYKIAINDPSLNNSRDTRSRYREALDGISKMLAVSILDGEIESINEIVGEMRPTRNASVFTFKLERVQ